MKTFDKVTAKEFQNVLLFIDDIFQNDHLVNLKVKNRNLVQSDGEYGFYLKNKNNRSEIFFGLWMEYWEEYGIPVCIAFDSDDRDYTMKKALFETYIKKNSDVFSKITIYDGFTTASIKPETIFKVGEEDKVSKMLKELYFILEFQN